MDSWIKINLINLRETIKETFDFHCAPESLQMLSHLSHSHHFISSSPTVWVTCKGGEQSSAMLPLTLGEEGVWGLPVSRLMGWDDKTDLFDYRLMIKDHVKFT